MLEALGRERLVQLFPTLRGLGYVVEWREGGMATMRKTLEWPTTSMTASPKLFLTGTVSLDVEDDWLRSEQMQHRWSGSADCREWDHIPIQCSVYDHREDRRQRHPGSWLEAPTTIARLYSMLLQLFSQRIWSLP